MRDLYKRLGVDPGATPDRIREAIAALGNPELRASAELILLSHSSRQRYDACRTTAERIGALRRALTLSDGHEWNAGFGDFHAGPEMHTSLISHQARQLLGLAQPAPPQPATTPPPKAHDGIGRGWIFAAVMAAALILWNEGCFSRSLSTKSPSAQTYDWLTAETPDAAAPPPFSEPPQTLPTNGTVFIRSREGPAPLEVVTKHGGGHTFVKLVRIGSALPTIEFFVREGKSAQVDVPVGSYELRYASGSTWYGPVHLFGPDTVYSMAGEVFEFTKKGDRVMGFVVELIPQFDGNLRTHRIDASKF